MNNLNYNLNCSSRIFIFMMLFCLISDYSLLFGNEHLESISVETITVAPEDFDYYIEFLGTAYASKDALLTAPAGGTVHKINLSRGDHVKKNQSLCDIDGQKAEIGLNISKLNEKLSSEKLSRTKAHLEKGTSSRTKQENDQLVWLRSKQELLNSKKIYQGAFCIAPFSGFIGETYITQFQEIGPYGKTFHLINLDSIKVIVDVPENEYDGYQKGNLAKLNTVSSSKEWTGKILNLGKSINHKSRTFSMELAFNTPDRKINHGALVNVLVLRKKMKNIILIPSSALQIGHTKTTVMVVHNGKAEKRTVQTGLQLISKTQITKGLNSGDKLIVSGADLAKDGQKVRVVN